MESVRARKDASGVVSLYEDGPELMLAAMRSVRVDPIWSGRWITRSARLSPLLDPQ